MKRPVVGIPCDIKLFHAFPFHAVGEKYITALTSGAGALPWLIPSLGDDALLDETLGWLDGILLPGSPSNIQPHLYGGAPSRAGMLHDPGRDASTLPLVVRAVERGLPVLGICRGAQEVNVALGGELYQHVQDEPGYFDHRESSDAPLERQYGPAHHVNLTPGGWLAEWAGSERIEVNSLHQQGVKRLAPGLVVEGVAEDGLVEAFRMDAARGFLLALQWHPEWQYWNNPVSTAIFRAFGDACRSHRDKRLE
ncbi:gamma-glutamyl-gamma-aminobutyrate hydrolase [Crenobacter luteus]|uniref:gamma-glutamyl-gamma-aminobutyrate hydrolase n=1 Tax=Crenobacter luteus TaxID=1452487 RepID=A0A165G414_9NEIS|nr:gamma-glutamyl-gamma-aminobutyrate hydrolase family protein [Crenobacter luteus]KZE35059.1 peptidase C26 [Crenobacter luteus]TCP11228.1 gamma-glutamyl-gamma-aminobutyrate hydrolase [Crenobacter luteus]